MKAKSFAALLAMVVFLLISARAASADVILNPPTASAGDVVDLSFHITNERPDAFTKKIEILFPSSPSFQSAQATAPTGWSSSVDELTGSVRSIVFDSGKLSGSDGADFVITVPVPIHSNRVVFPITQTYSDGQTVKWWQDPMAGASSNLHIAPVLEVKGAITTTTAAVPSGTTTTVNADSTKNKKDSSGRSGASFALVGLGVAILYGVTIRRKRIAKNRG